MIPKARNWRVTFFITHRTDDGVSFQTKVSVNVVCVKRFAKSIANELLGYPAFRSHKITVGLIK